MKSREWIERGAKSSIEKAEDAVGYLKCAFYNIIGLEQSNVYKREQIDIYELDREFRDWLHNHNDGSAKFNAVYALWNAFNSTTAISNENEYTLEHLTD